MKDFNFFSPYLMEKRNKRQKKLFIIAASSLIIIGFLSFTALNMYQISTYKSEISKVESYLKSKEAMELLKKYEDTTQKVELTDTYYNKVYEVDRLLNAENTVNTDFLDKLSAAMTKNSTMTELVISKNEVEVQYKVDGLIPVAEIEHNLKSLNIFERVHVSAINHEASYTAIISCSLKDVNTNEAKTDK